MNFENVISIISILGIGGVLGAYFKSLWDKNSTIALQKQEYKEVRYKCIMILMLVYLDFENKRWLLEQNNRSYIKTSENLMNELKTEWNNMILYASEDVLKGFDKFIKDASHDNYKELAIYMRKDLWGGKIKADFIKNLG